MAEKTFIIAAPVDQARSLVGSVFTQGGWTVELSPTGGLVLTRGKKGLTIAFGAFMGSSFYRVQSVEFGTGPQGTAATYRSSSTSALIGGALGVRKSNKTHAEYVEKLTQALQAAGVLVGVQ